MRVSRLSVFLMVLFLCAVASPALALEHFEFENTDSDMSILVNAVTLDGEAMNAGDEIGVFTEDGLCAGADVVAEDGRSGPPAVGAEAEMDNGFQPNEQITFVVWDAATDTEAPAEITRVLQGDPVWVANALLVVTLAAERPPEMPNIWVSDVEHDFGNVMEGTEAEWSFTVGNDGGEVLNVTNVTVAGDRYSVNFEEAVALNPDDEIQYTVTFAPLEGDDGEFNGVVTVVSDDPDEEEVTINLFAVAEPAIPPTIRLSTNNINFGGVLVGNLRSRTVTIYNDGDELLEVQDATLDSDVFSVDFEGQIDLAAGESADLTIVFEPVDFMEYAGELVITSNDPVNDVVSVNLAGEGLDPDNAGIIGIAEVEVKVIDDVELHFAPFFGYVVTGESLTQRWTLINEGGADLYVDDIVIDDDDFSVEMRPGADRIRRGDSGYFDVTFSPRRDDLYEDVIMTIFSDDPANGEYHVILGGNSGRDLGTHYQSFNTGENHSLIVQEVTLDGQAMAPGNEVAVYTNAGLLAGNGTVMDDGRAGVAAYGDANETNITDGFADGESFDFRVWDMEAEMEYAGAFEILNDGPETYEAGGITVISLAAFTGDPDPEIYLRRTGYYFGQVAIDGSAEWTFRIENHGLGTLTIESIESDMGEFTTDFEGPADIAERGILDVNVTFAPREEGEFTARLTIVSNDPNDSPFYVDLTGDGAVNPQNPVVDMVENYFYGVGHVDAAIEYQLEINSVGQARLDITELNYEGDGAFTSNWDGQNHVVDPGETFELTVVFTPDAVREYNGVFFIQTNADEEPREFAVRGYGAVSDDHFLNYVTEVGHTITATSPVIITRQGNELPLYPGDEIAVFNSNGLCAGHGVVDTAGHDVGIMAYANDPNNVFADGFVAGEGFMFKFFDISTGDELDCEVEFVDGPEVFNVGGETTVILEADAITEEPMIFVENRVLQLGAVRVDEQNEGVFTIQNIGGADLRITDVTSDLLVFTTDFDQPVVLEPNESFDLNAVFSPSAPRSYQGVLTIESDDPHEVAFEVYPCGIGSEVAADAHFVYGRSGVGQQILINEIDLGGAPPAIGDEIAVFTEDGFCAGAAIVQDPRAAQGLAAWGDDSDTEYLIEGFHANEPMTLVFFDEGQGIEYDEIEVNVIRGSMNFRDNNFTVIEIAIAGVFSIVPVDPIDVAEGDEVSFDLTLNNAEGNFEYTWSNPDEYENLDNAEFNQGNNEAHFVWQTDVMDAGVYELLFVADNGDGLRDQTTVVITVNDVNQPPIVDEDVLLEVFGQDMVIELEQNVAEDQNQAWVPIVDCNDLFINIDDDDVIYYFNDQIPPEQIEQRIVNGVYSLRPAVGFIGTRDDAFLTANDQFVAGRDVAVRSVRRVGEHATPNRDYTTTIDFTIVVNDVPEPPVVEGPDEDEWVNFTEGVERTIDFRATDPDAEGNHEWSIADDANLPAGWEFVVDNENLTAQFIWTPGFDDAGDYEGIVVELSDDFGDDVQRIFNIRVANANREPEIAAPDNNQEFVVAEGELLEFALTGSDEDEEDGLVWSIQDRDGMSRAAVIINDDGEGNARFHWETTLVDEGDYSPVLRLTDNGEPAATFAEVTVNITVNHTNANPEAGEDVDDRVMDEDSQLVIDLSGAVIDIDENDVITFALVGAADELNVSIDGHEMTIAPIANFNTADDQGRPTDLLIQFSGTDNNGGPAVESQFNIAVAPVNDAPEAFNQTAPENETEVGADVESLTFTWDEATQNEWEIDGVTYNVVFWLAATPDDTYMIEGVEATTVENVLIADIMEGLQVNHRPEDVWVSWRIDAVDSEATTSATNAPFRFKIPPSAIGDVVNNIPEDFYMSGNYPNPFNPETTVQFGVPSASEVNITVWDMHGRRVAELYRGIASPGRYEVVWNATEFTSGIYVIRMQAGSFTAMNKAVLVR